MRHPGEYVVQKADSSLSRDPIGRQTMISEARTAFQNQTGHRPAIIVIHVRDEDVDEIYESTKGLFSDGEDVL